jgi:hypothetical protein
MTEDLLGYLDNLDYLVHLDYLDRYTIKLLRNSRPYLELLRNWRVGFTQEFL